VHEGGFRVEGQAPDRLRFYTAEAKLLPQTPPPPPPLATDPLDTLRAQQAELTISADTPATWRGERMDYSWAIDSLLRADNRIDSVLGLGSSAASHLDSHADCHPDSHPAASDNQPPLPAAWLS
jgi:hypothetical protein